MVHTRRKKISQTIFRIVIWATILSMGLSAVLFKFFGKSDGLSLATVNGDIIEVKDFNRRAQATQRRLEMLRMQFEQAGMPYDPQVFERNPYAHALQSLVNDTLLDQVARDLNVAMEEQYIATKITDPYFLTAELPEFVSPYALASMGELSRQSIERILKHEGVRIADFEQYLEKSLARKVVRDLIDVSIYVPSYAARQAYIQQYAAKNYDVVTIPFERVLEKEKAKELPDAEMKKWYEKNRRDYTVPEKRSGVVWEFDPARYGIEVNDLNVLKFYNRNKNMFVKDPIKVKVRRILLKVANQADSSLVHTRAQLLRQELLQSPDNFAAKAKEMSEDIATAKSGGVVEFFARGEKDPAFEQVAFSLQNDNEISPVIQTKEGFEIIQRVARRPVTYKDLEDVRSEVEKTVLQQTFIKRFMADVERLKTQEAVAEFAKEKRASKKNLDAVTKTNDPIRAKLFSLKAGTLGATKTEDAGVVVFLNSVEPSFVPAYDNVKDKVAADIYRSKAQTTIRDLIVQAGRKARSAEMDEIAEQFGGKLRKINGVKGDDADRLKELTKEGLPVVQMIPMEQEGEIVTAVEGNGYVVKLTEIDPISEGAWKTKKDAVMQALLRDWSGVELNSFVASLARSGKISINEKALSQGRMGSFNSEDE